MNLNKIQIHVLFSSFDEGFSHIQQHVYETFAGGPGPGACGVFQPYPGSGVRWSLIHSEIFRKKCFNSCLLHLTRSFPDPGELCPVSRVFVDLLQPHAPLLQGLECEMKSSSTTNRAEWSLWDSQRLTRLNGSLWERGQRRKNTDRGSKREAPLESEGLIWDCVLC